MTTRITLRNWHTRSTVLFLMVALLAAGLFAAGQESANADATSASWVYPLTGSSSSRPIAGPSGEVAVVDDTHTRVEAITPTGSSAWTVQAAAGHNFLGESVVDGQGTQYWVDEVSDEVSQFNDTIIAVRAGAVIWQQPVRSPSGCALRIIDPLGHTQYLRTGADGNVYALAQCVSQPDGLVLLSFRPTTGELRLHVAIPESLSRTTMELAAYDEGLAIIMNGLVQYYDYDGNKVAEYAVPEFAGTSDYAAVGVHGETYLGGCAADASPVLTKVLPSSGVAWRLSIRPCGGQIWALPNGGVLIDDPMLGGLTTVTTDGVVAWNQPNGTVTASNGNPVNLNPRVEDIDASGSVLFVGGFDSCYPQSYGCYSIHLRLLDDDSGATLATAEVINDQPRRAAFGPGRFHLVTVADPTISEVHAFANQSSIGSYPSTNLWGNVQPPRPQCSDQLDNDGDGNIDYPADSGCGSAQDDDESDDPAPAVVKPLYYALGDSVVAGHGLRPYLQEGCHRSERSYVYGTASQLIQGGHTATFSSAQHYACAGAIAREIRQQAEAVENEIEARLLRLHARGTAVEPVDALISLDAGINDFRFDKSDGARHVMCDGTRAFTGWVEQVLQDVRGNVAGLGILAPKKARLTKTTILGRLLRIADTTIVVQGYYNPLYNPAQPLVAYWAYVASITRDCGSAVDLSKRMVRAIDRADWVVDRINRLLQDIVAATNRLYQPNALGPRVRFVQLSTSLDVTGCFGPPEESDLQVAGSPQFDFEEGEFTLEGNDCVHPSDSGMAVISEIVASAMVAPADNQHHVVGDPATLDIEDLNAV